MRANSDRAVVQMIQTRGKRRYKNTDLKTLAMTLYLKKL